MKKFILFAMTLVLTVNFAIAQGGTELNTGAKIKFEKTSHDFGSKPQGTPATYDFVFKNIGNAPLVLQDVKAACGCTTPFWPKEPIMPGQESKISATYNMAKAGSFSKTITVTTAPQAGAESGEQVILTISGNALAAANENSVDEARPSIISNPNK
jgi:hypothetical protein